MGCGLREHMEPSNDQVWWMFTRASTGIFLSLSQLDAFIKNI